MVNNGTSTYRKEGMQNLKSHETNQRCIKGRDVWYLNIGTLSSDYAFSSTSDFFFSFCRHTTELGTITSLGNKQDGKGT